MQFARNLLFCCAAILLGCAAVNAQQADAPSTTAVVPRLVNFSGKATDPQGKLISGIAGITFSIYSTQYEGTPLWMETQNVNADARGNYTVQLGASSAEGLPLDLFTSGEARWLGVRVNNGEELPRVLLLSVPYALKAADAQTLGGLPASAFVLAAPPNNSASTTSSGASAATVAPPATAVTGTGTVGYVPLWDTTSDIVSSVLFQTGSGSTAKIGVNTTTPASTLDVKGGATVRGTLSLPATASATSTAGKISQPLTVAASAFNSTSSTALNQVFQWQAEPAGNDTASPSGTLNLLFGEGATKPSETGLHIASNGNITFATGQTFPGTGTITGITTASGSGLNGGGTSGALNLSLTNTCATNQVLQWNGSAWACAAVGTGTITGVTAGTDLTGGGTSGAITLNLDTTKVPLLAAANTFTGNQAVNGNLSATGMLTGSGFQIGSTLFAFGSTTTANAFLGFAGNSTMTGTANTATGSSALQQNTTGFSNTASGSYALTANTSGDQNTAVGSNALQFNTTGYDNTAIGNLALFSNTTAVGNTASGQGALWVNSTGNYNTASGTSALSSNTTGSNNTATGYQALPANTSGISNTASGYFAGAIVDGSNLIGFNNSFLGANTALSTGTLNDATAIGSNAEVSVSNAIVLGSILGTNYCEAASGCGNTSVGIGTTAPAATLHLDLLDNGGSGASDSLLMGNTSTRGLEFSDGVSAANIVSFGVPLFINNSGGQNTVLNGNGGKVGIGTSSPSNILTLSPGGGPAIAAGWTTYSSRRWKTNIRTLPDALAKIEQLRGVSYDLKTSGKHEIGVIAEEVGQVVPEVVSYEKNGKDAQGVDYSRLTALLIEAVKQQQGLIRKQQAQIRTQRAEMKAQRAQITRLGSQVKAIQAALKTSGGTSEEIRTAKAWR